MKRNTIWQKARPYVFSIAVALAVGALSALLTQDGMDAYPRLNRPPLAPPAVVFPIVWSVLFTLMGVSSARIYLAPESPERRRSLVIYAVQLALNFCWTILFFGFSLYLAAFLWLLALEAAIIYMIISFLSVDRAAGLLQIPYALWVVFAGYLNLAIAVMN